MCVRKGKIAYECIELVQCTVNNCSQLYLQLRAIRAQNLIENNDERKEKNKNRIE